MTTHKKLISYNSEKHPEVSRFFEELEDTNLTSHYVREAIKFYEQFKNQVTTTINIPAVETKPFEKITGEKPFNKKEVGEEQQETTVDPEDEYEDFNPQSIL